MTSPLRYAFLGAPVLLAAAALAPPAHAQSTATRVVQGYSACLTAPTSDPCWFQAGGPLTPVVGGSSLSATVIKASAGYLKRIDFVSGTAGFAMLFNATVAPANGSTTPGTAPNQLQECIPLAANTLATLNFGEAPEPFTTGITVVFSSTSCPTQTSASIGFFRALVQ